MEALRPPARSPLFAGASNRHHLPEVGRPTPLFLPGRIAEPVLAPGAIADSMPDVKNAGGSPHLPCNGGNGGWPAVWDLILIRVLHPGLILQDRPCDQGER
jgi:hypothetical protein